MIRKALLLFILSLSLAWSSSVINAKNGIMLSGFDPVSYFTEKSPQKGKRYFSHKYKGAKFLFVSQANKETFLKTPEQFIPQFGGWCATATALGYKYRVQPKNYRITEGKLYLFARGAQKPWKKDEQNYIQQANKNWPTVKHLEES